MLVFIFMLSWKKKNSPFRPLHSLNNSDLNSYKTLIRQALRDISKAHLKDFSKAKSMTEGPATQC